MGRSECAAAIGLRNVLLWIALCMLVSMHAKSACTLLACRALHVSHRSSRCDASQRVPASVTLMNCDPTGQTNMDWLYILAANLELPCTRWPHAEQRVIHRKGPR